jgi:hypothetical protein
MAMMTSITTNHRIDYVCPEFSQIRIRLMSPHVFPGVVDRPVAPIVAPHIHGRAIDLALSLISYRSLPSAAKRRDTRPAWRRASRHCDQVHSELIHRDLYPVLTAKLTVILRIVPPCLASPSRALTRLALPCPAMPHPAVPCLVL